MKSLQKNVKKQLSVFLMLMLVLSVNLTAQSAMPSMTEKTDSGAEWLRQAQPPQLTIEEVMEIAEEEIERTAQEAVKAAMIEVGGELAYEKARADQLETAKKNLEEENKKLKAEAQKKQNQFFYGALIGGAGGVIVTSIVFNLVMGVCK